jgi:hypothetical protein
MIARGQRFIPHRLFEVTCIPDWILSRPELSFGTKCLYGRLCRYAGQNGEAFPSAERLAQDLGSNVRSVRRWIKELVEWGLIEIEEKPGSVNRYFFLGHLWMEHVTPDNLSPQGCQDVTPDPGHFVTPDPGHFVTPPLTFCPPTPDILSPKENHEENQLRELVSTPTARARVHEGGRGAVGREIAAAYQEPAALLLGTFQRVFDDCLGQPLNADQKQTLLEHLRFHVEGGRAEQITLPNLQAACTQALKFCCAKGRPRPTIREIAHALSQVINPGPKPQEKHHGERSRTGTDPRPNYNLLPTHEKPKGRADLMQAEYLAEYIKRTGIGSLDSSGDSPS